MAYIKELKVTYTRKRVDDDLLSQPMQSPEQVYQLFKFMQDETKEKVVVLHLNPQLEVLSYEVASIGTANYAVLEPSEIYRNAVLARASSIIVIHNHPSGQSTPSEEDMKAASHLDDSLKLGRMPLQDFIIIGFEHFYSFREQGYL
jgi:DNA repair protein RadC